MSKKLFFSTESINWDDDESIEAFAQAVWEASVKEFREDAAPTQSNDDAVLKEGEIR